MSGFSQLCWAGILILMPIRWLYEYGRKIEQWFARGETNRALEAKWTPHG